METRISDAGEKPKVSTFAGMVCSQVRDFAEASSVFSTCTSPNNNLDINRGRLTRKGFARITSYNELH